MKRRLMICAMLVACGGNQKQDREENDRWMDALLRKRATFDLNCPEATLTVTRLGNDTRGVEGCGQKASYVYQRGNWLMNTINGAEAPQSAGAEQGSTL